MTKANASKAHSESIESVLARLRVDLSGLTSVEAGRRLAENGGNTLEFRADRSAWRIFLAQFASIVVWLLGAAALAAVLTGSAVEAAAIVAVLLLNAAIGFFIEWQASRALSALRRVARTTARVRRNGQEMMIDAADLVVGDIVVLASGDRVPADCRLAEAASLRTDESSLTGESTPVEKSITEVESTAPLAEQSAMVFLGTSILAGRGVGIVTATGRATELGQVGELLEETDDTKTPLERRLAQLGKRLVYFVLAISLVVLIAGFIRGDDPWLMAKVSISLAVAAVPEGLPAVTTLILALGVLRMARASAIVRHLAAVETLGSTTVICTDKTGTLTENRMVARVIFLPGDRFIRFDDASKSTTVDRMTDRLLRVAVLCNEAAFTDTTGEAIGDPTETALLSLARQLGFDVAGERRQHHRVAEIPFDALRKKMIAVVDTGESGHLAMLKGAPAVVLEACDDFLDSSGELRQMTREIRDRFIKVNEHLANDGLRILAFADRKCQTEAVKEDDNGYTFLGLVGMSDPPRAEVPDAIRQARNAGIRVVMLTGDQTLTGEAVARELELSEGDDIFSLHSRDLTELDDSRLAEFAQRAHVFARVTPEDKLRIVRALQKAGEIVAVTGDGVNDAPALKQSDIGVAMGMRGTEVAKEAADIILTDDNFSTIVRAVEGGRTIYANIIKFVHLMFSHNLGEILVIFGAILLYLPVPLLPLQILWINLVTDIFPALALAVEPPTKETMLRAPRSPKASFLSARFMILIGWQGALLASIALAAYVWALSVYGDGREAKTVALLAVVGVEVGHLFNCRSRTRSTFEGFFSNPYIFIMTGIVIGLQLLAIVNPFLARLLDLTIPTRADWVVIGLTVIVPIIVVEITKLIARRRFAGVQHQPVYLSD